MERGYWIKSKPIYTSLVWHEKATSHLVLASGICGITALKLFQQMYPAPSHGAVCEICADGS